MEQYHINLIKFVTPSYGRNQKGWFDIGSKVF